MKNTTELKTFRFPRSITYNQRYILPACFYRLATLFIGVWYQQYLATRKWNLVVDTGFGEKKFSASVRVTTLLSILMITSVIQIKKWRDRYVHAEFQVFIFHFQAWFRLDYRGVAMRTLVFMLKSFARISVLNITNVWEKLFSR